MAKQSRIIIFHKHPVSAKVRFLRQAYGGICGFHSLPKLASVVDDDSQPEQDNVVSHPLHITHEAEKTLGLEKDSLQLESEYQQRVEVPDGIISIYLAGIKGHDTPDKTLAENNARLQLITEMRGLVPAEMMLLRRAYEVIMEG